MLHDLLRRTERIRNGLEVPENNRLDVPITQHLESFRKHLLAKGTSKKQVRENSNGIRCIIEACEFNRWNNIPTIDQLFDRRSRCQYLKGIFTDEVNITELQPIVENWYDRYEGELRDKDNDPLFFEDA